MKRIHIVGIVFYALVMMAGLAVLLHNGLDDELKPNIPLINERANACYGGASLSGLCSSEEDWVCGWSVIRLEDGLMTREEFPLECVSMLPSQAAAETSS
jgi:hypothetical protein